MKLLKYLVFLVKKIRFIRYKNVQFPMMMQMPLSLNLEIDKNSKVKFGKKIGINKNVTIRVRDNANCKIGDNVSFNNGCILTCRDKIQIGNNVLFGPNVMIFDHDHNYKLDDFRNNFITDEIIIEDNVWIGANVIILKGAHIRKNSVIAAGTVVKSEVEENTIFYNERIERTKKIKNRDEE